MKKILFFTAVMLSVCTLSAKAPGGWESKVEKAVAKAKAGNKPLFIVVSGGGWDKKSIGFEKKVLENKDFLKLASKYAVCLYIDHPSKPAAKEKAEIDKCKSLFGKKLVLPGCAVANPDLNAVGVGGKTKKDMFSLLQAISDASAEVGGAEMTELPKLKAKYDREAKKAAKEKEKNKKKKEKNKKKKNKK